MFKKLKSWFYSQFFLNSNAIRLQASAFVIWTQKTIYFLIYMKNMGLHRMGQVTHFTVTLEANFRCIMHKTAKNPKYCDSYQQLRGNWPSKLPIQFWSTFARKHTQNLAGLNFGFHWWETVKALGLRKCINIYQSICNVGAETMCSGREFQIWAAATGKSQLLTVKSPNWIHNQPIGSARTQCPSTRDISSRGGRPQENSVICMSTLSI